MLLESISSWQNIKWQWIYLTIWNIIKHTLSFKTIWNQHWMNINQLNPSMVRLLTKWATAWDFQQFDILTSVDSDKPVQSPFKPRSSKWCSNSSLTIKNIKATSKGSDQTARMRRLIWVFAGHTYHNVGNLMHWLKCFLLYTNPVFFSIFSYNAK